jgi:hypothetical protein
MTAPKPYHLQRALYKSIICASTLCLVVAMSAPYLFPVSAQSSASEKKSAKTPGPPARITFDPPTPSAAPGTRIKITATVRDKDGVEIPEASSSANQSKWKWAFADSGLEEFADIKPAPAPTGQQGNTVSVVGLFGNPPGSQTTNTMPSIIPIIVTYDGPPTVWNVVNVHLDTGVPPPGAIPPGLSPQVDVMWSVLPSKIVHDNFGKRIKDEYYGIELVVGNNSGYDLQIASVGFTAPQLFLASGSNKYKLPTVTYQMTRGTLIREQQVGFRNTLVGALNAFGPILTGTVPYFHSVPHRSNFSQFINVFSNPLEKGVELVAPDTTIGHLVRLEQQSLRIDNANNPTVIRNNTQYATVTFFPKGQLEQYFNEHKEINRKDPTVVMQVLGDLVLIGQPVQYLNRVSLIGAAVKPTSTFAVSGQVTDRCNNGLAGITMTLSGDASFKPLTVTTEPNGIYTFDNVPAGGTYTVKPSKESFIFNPASSESFVLGDNQGHLNFKAEQQSYKISGTVMDATGGLVSGATVELSGPGVTTVTKTTGADGKYSFEKLKPGVDYNLKVTASGKTFNPETVGALNCDKTVDFKAQ